MVSVIIPNYNHERYLRERIDSVLAQTFDDFEVIILDDCSPDNSRDVIEFYRSHPKVSHIVYNDTNSGSTFRQWHKGFDLAQGEWIWIAESDDVAHPDFLNRLMKAVDNDPEVVLAASGITFIDENSHPTGNITISGSRHPRRYSSKGFIRENMLLGNHLLNASSAIFRKDVAKSLPQDYTQMRSSGDYLFWLELASRGRVVEIPDHLDYFRKSSVSVTPRLYGNGHAFDEAFLIFDWLKNHNYLRGLYSNIVVGYRLYQIRQSTHFNSEEVRKSCFDKWRAKSVSPTLDHAILMAYGLWRRARRSLRNL